jgi:uncharacterized membrane protein
VIRLALWIAAGLLLGLLVHLATLLALPSLATRDASRRLESLTREGGFHLLPTASPSEAVLPSPDPSIVMAACRFDLSRGPVHVRAPLTGSFFSVSFYTPDGLAFYALTDRAAPEGAIELTLYTSLQLAEVRSREGPDTPEALRLEAPKPEGLIVLRALAPEPSYGPILVRTLSSATCESSPATSGLAPRLSARDGMGAADHKVH